jgi:hypothetical protein
MAIIKYKETFVGMANVVYEEIETPFKKGKRMTKEEAKTRIKELGLVKVYSDKNGVIWDKEDEPLYQEFHSQGRKIKDI